MVYFVGILPLVVEGNLQLVVAVENLQLEVVVGNPKPEVAVDIHLLVVVVDTLPFGVGDILQLGVKVVGNLQPEAD